MFVVLYIVLGVDYIVWIRACALCHIRIIDKLCKLIGPSANITAIVENCFFFFFSASKGKFHSGFYSVLVSKLLVLFFKVPHS